MPTYAALIYDDAAKQYEEPGTDEWAAVMADYQEFGEKAGAAGVLLGGEALHPTDTATTITVDAKGGDMVSTDGPFAETKEALGGFYLLKCADLDEALEWARQIPGAWHGRVEVRPCMEFDD